MELLNLEVEELAQSVGSFELELGEGDGQAPEGIVLGKSASLDQLVDNGDHEHGIAAGVPLEDARELGRKMSAGKALIQVAVYFHLGQSAESDIEAKTMN
jgi:hypothetical protein